MSKESFLIYKSFYEPIKSLSDDQLGRLFRALFQFNLGEEIEVEEDISMAYKFFKNQFRLDNEKYDRVVERNRINGSKGGRRPVTNPNNPVGSKKSDKDKENGNGNEKVEEIYKSYPNRCIIKGNSTGKTSKNKNQIRTILKTISPDKLLATISWYVNDCKSTNTYMKNFSTFLNNLPDISDDNLNITQDNNKPQGKIRQ